MLTHLSSPGGGDGHLHEAATRLFVLISPNFTVLLSANGDLGEVYLMLAGVDTCHRQRQQLVYQSQPSSSDVALRTRG